MVKITKRVGEPDYLGDCDYFRRLANKMVKSVVSQNKWFSFGRRTDKRQVDVLRVKNDAGVSLGRMLYDSAFTEDCELDFLIAIYKYLVRNYLCYYEAPVIVKDNGTQRYKNSFDKYLITSNLWVISKWLGISYEDAERVYGGKLESDENESSLMPYYKLYSTPDGTRKITNPRKLLDVGISGSRIIPVFALKTGVGILYEKLCQGTFDVVFSKDSGQERVINTTFNMDKIKEVYKNNDYIVKATDCWFDGDFDTNPNLERGYIRVFEMGSSVYDSPTRSINYARIIEFKEADPDLSCVNVDLDSVLEKFKDSVSGNTNIEKNIDEFLDCLEMFGMSVDKDEKGNRIRLSIYQLSNWAEEQYLLFSTVFLRKLALFMLGNPQWFDGYTGESYVRALDTADWGDDDDLDIG